MGVGIGRAILLGTSEEVTYGTPVAIDRRYEVLSESLQRQNTVLQSQGLGGGLNIVRRGASRVISARMGSGDVTMEVATTGMGRWFKHMIGGTPTITQQETTAAYLQTHTAGPLTGKSLTVQKVIRDGAGTVISPFTLHGCKVTSWSLSVEVESIPSLTVTLDAEDVDTSTSGATLAGLAAPAPSVFTFLGASLTVNGTAAARVLSAEVNADNALKTDSFFLGSSGLKAEPEADDFRSITGTLSAELLDTTYYDLFAADTGVALVLSFVGDNIATTYDEELTITIPQIHFTGETPTVSGAGVVEQPAPFEASYNDVDDPLTITYQSADTVI